MSLDFDFNPNVFDTIDLAALREAVRQASELTGTANEQERLHVASIVLSFYNRGLRDPTRLAEIALFASSSRVYRSQYAPCLHSRTGVHAVHRPLGSAGLHGSAVPVA